MKLLMLGACFALVSACANINTIDRTTSFRPPSKDQAKAVHLDIQQRLLMMNKDGVYCAEPSPDGLAAYAAAVGLAASNPASEAISASGSGGSAAASIGLRSQSITLMRDAMYRVCEAYANDQIGKAQVATLLGRSQDLTAVVLAVEQLTGPLTANQASLTTTSDAATAASLIATARQLELAIEAYDRASTRVTEAEGEKVETQTELNKVSADLTAKKALQDGDDAPTDPAESARLAEQIAFLEARQSQLQSKITIIDGRLESLKEAKASAERTRDTIAAKQATAFASADAGTGSSAAFSSIANASKISPQASETVALAVKDMVNNVVNKNYLTESCISVLSGGIAAAKMQNEATKKTFEQSCLELVQAEIEARQAAARLSAAQQNKQVELLELSSKSDLERVLAAVTTNGKLDTQKRDAVVLIAVTKHRLSTGFANLVQAKTTLGDLRTLLNGATELTLLERAATDFLEPT